MISKALGWLPSPWDVRVSHHMPSSHHQDWLGGGSAAWAGRKTRCPHCPLGLLANPYPSVSSSPSMMYRGRTWGVATVQIPGPCPRNSDSVSPRGAQQPACTTGKPVVAPPAPPHSWITHLCYHLFLSGGDLLLDQ